MKNLIIAFVILLHTQVIAQTKPEISKLVKLVSKEVASSHVIVSNSNAKKF